MKESSMQSKRRGNENFFSECTFGSRFFFNFSITVPNGKYPLLQKIFTTYIDDINLHSGCAFLQEEGCAIAE